MEITEGLYDQKKEKNDVKFRNGEKSIKFKRGAKLGARAGSIAGTITAIGVIAYAYTVGEKFEGIIILIGAVIYAILGAIVGVFFGMMYTAVYRYLPCRKNISKGILLGIILIIIEIGIVYQLGTLINVATVLILGFTFICVVLIGFLWDSGILIVMSEKKRQRIIKITAFCGAGLFILLQIFEGNMDVITIMSTSISGSLIFGGLAALVLK